MDHELAAEPEERDQTELGEREPGKRERLSECDAESEDRELGRHSEIREDRNRRSVVIGETRLRACTAEPLSDETFYESVLRRDSIR